LGHQLAAQGHINLIKRAVQQVLSLEALPRDRDGKMLKALKRVCQEIEKLGSSLKITKRNGHVIAEGWDRPEFAVGPNEHKEVCDRQLHHYQSPDGEAKGIPQELIMAHRKTSGKPLFSNMGMNAIGDFNRSQDLQIFNA
jgi:hypothetical protein